MRDRWIVALLLALPFALYANAFRNDFVFDDHLTFLRNEAIRSFDTLPKLFNDYRPLRYMSFAIDYAVSGNSPWGYHLFNTIYHGVVSVLVFVVLRRLAGPVAALAGALLFLAHPAHTEAVAYISGRRDLLSTLFFLLGLLCWLEFNRTARRRWLGFFVLAWGAALGVKEMAVTLPAICALHDVLLEPEKARRRWWLYAGGLVLAGGAAVAIALSGATEQPTWHGGSAAANFATSARLLVHYARLFLFPLHLLGDYSYDAYPLSRSFLEMRVILSLVAIGGGVAAAILCRRRAPLVSLGLAWFVVTLLPVLHIIPFHELATDHYLYLPSVGGCLLAGLALDRLAARFGRRPAWAALAVLFLAFSARTVVRNLDWKDSETFWRKIVEDAPRCARANGNLGIVYAQRREWPAAAHYLERAVEILPDYVFARTQLGRIYRDQLGRAAEGTAQLEEALRLARAAKNPTVSPGHICFLLQRPGEAIPLLESDIRRGRHPRSALKLIVVCHQMLGAGAEAAGKADEAKRHFSRALEACERLLLELPRDAQLLGQALALAEKTGNRRRAAEFASRAAALRGSSGR
jgi:tetratricopeptide (TPR) repeat protein